MKLPEKDCFQAAYRALQDETSRRIYRHRLLYALTGEAEEIRDMVLERLLAEDYDQQCNTKICCYGAGAGGLTFIEYNCQIPFVIDQYKTGSIMGIPIISLDEFLRLPDCKEYLIFITVAMTDLKEEIQTILTGLGLRWILAYPGVQYFDLPELNLRNEYFVDAGALDGETSKYFLTHFENGHTYTLEPNPKQLDIIRERLRPYPQAEIFPFGVYDQNTVMRFETRYAQKGSSKLLESGELEVEVRRLDDLLEGRKVTFLKMDIEGSELAALRGAERIIREQRPKLAICVYHKPEDIWEIPSFILGCHPDYKLYLRHYSMGSTETILYAI